MTDEQIIKALKCCREFSDCDGCQYGYLRTGNGLCIYTMQKDALDLINRQQEEIEVLEQSKDNKLLLSLEQENEDLKETIDKLVIDMNKIKTETIKEFAEKLKEKFGISDVIITIDSKDIDNFVKEIIESEVS